MPTGRIPTGKPTVEEAFPVLEANLKVNRVVNDKIGFVVGHVCSGATIAATEIYNNEGVVMVAAEHCDAGHVNFMARQARGLVCLTLTQERCRQLNLPPMVEGFAGKGTRRRRQRPLSHHRSHGIGDPHGPHRHRRHHSRQGRHRNG